MAFVTKLTLGFLTFSNIVNKELLLVENTPHGHKLCQFRRSACLQMTVYREIKNEIDSQQLQKDSNSLMKWEYDWQMHFNPQKCFAMRLTDARHMTRFNYTLGDKSLQETDNHPYLGVRITKYITWNKHIHQITVTANRTLAFVRRNLYSCPQHSQTCVTWRIHILIPYLPHSSTTKSCHICTWPCKLLPQPTALLHL